MSSPIMVPDTVSYLIAGTLVFSLALILYLASLITRWRKAAAEYRRYQQDLSRE